MNIDQNPEKIIFPFINVILNNVCLKKSCQCLKNLGFITLFLFSYMYYLIMQEIPDIKDPHETKRGEEKI